MGSSNREFLGFMILGINGFDKLKYFILSYEEKGYSFSSIRFGDVKHQSEQYSLEELQRDYNLIPPTSRIEMFFDKSIESSEGDYDVSFTIKSHTSINGYWSLEMRITDLQREKNVLKEIKYIASEYINKDFKAMIFFRAPVFAGLSFMIAFLGFTYEFDTIQIGFIILTILFVFIRYSITFVPTMIGSHKVYSWVESHISCLIISVISAIIGGLVTYLFTLF